jgi:ElaB/YqjD/DUF883 family membrane-anchored ribosome-binding protein
MTHEPQMSRLIADTKNLLFQLRDSKDPEVRRLRDQVSELIARRRANNNRGLERSVKLTRLPGSIVRYVQEHPWLAVVTVASLSWTLSHLSTASRER